MFVLIGYEIEIEREFMTLYIHLCSQFLKCRRGNYMEEDGREVP